MPHDLFCNERCFSATYRYRPHSYEPALSQLAGSSSSSIAPLHLRWAPGPRHSALTDFFSSAADLEVPRVPQSRGQIFLKDAILIIFLLSENQSPGFPIACDLAIFPPPVSLFLPLSSSCFLCVFYMMVNAFSTFAT